MRNIVVPGASSNLGSKNLEENMKKMRGELREICKQRDRSDEELAQLKKEHGKVKMRLGNALSSRSSKENDAKKATDGKLDVLRKSNADLTAKLTKERSARENQGVLVEKYGRAQRARRRC